MEQPRRVSLRYSLKNITTTSANSYRKGLIEMIERSCSNFLFHMVTFCLLPLCFGVRRRNFIRCCVYSLPNSWELVFPRTNLWWNNVGGCHSAIRWKNANPVWSANSNEKTLIEMIEQSSSISQSGWKHFVYVLYVLSNVFGTSLYSCTLGHSFLTFGPELHTYTCMHSFVRLIASLHTV